MYIIWYTMPKCQNSFGSFSSFSILAFLVACRNLVLAVLAVLACWNSPVSASNLMREAYSKFIEIVKLIERNYGRGKITPNLYLSIYLFDCSFDYGSLYSFWYFSFEHMNGILDKLLSDFLINFWFLIKTAYNYAI